MLKSLEVDNEFSVRQSPGHIDDIRQLRVELGIFFLEDDELVLSMIGKDGDGVTREPLPFFLYFFGYGDTALVVDLQTESRPGTDHEVEWLYLVK